MESLSCFMMLSAHEAGGCRKCPVYDESFDKNHGHRKSFPVWVIDFLMEIGYYSRIHGLSIPICRIMESERRKFK